MTTTSSNTQPPLSKRIADDLEERILNGSLRKGERLASEDELAREFGVARGTMRSALSILKDRELVSTRAGVGTFVAFDGARMDDPTGWTAASAKGGSPTTTELISADRVAAPGHLASLVPAGTEFHRIIRRRLAGREVVSLEISYLPSNEILDLIMERGLLGGSLSITMRAAGLITSSSSQDLSVEKAPDALHEYLEANGGTRFLVSRKSNFSTEGALVEHVVSYLHPDHFSMHIEFTETPSNEH